MGVVSIFVLVVFAVLSIIFFVIPQLESYDIIEGVRGGRGGGPVSHFVIVVISEISQQ